MAYKKPQVVAKSAAKQSFVATCPAVKVYDSGAKCSSSNWKCEMGPCR